MADCCGFMAEIDENGVLGFSGFWVFEEIFELGELLLDITPGVVLRVGRVTTRGLLWASHRAQGGMRREKRLAYAVYMLVGEAEHWWRGTHHMLTARGVVVDWECFRRVFLEKYFPESVRHAKEAEFMRLHQGGLKFAEGLKQELKRVVVPMAITEFLALLEKAKVVERLEGGNRVMKSAEGPAGQPTDAARGGRQGGGATLRCYRCAGPHFVRDCPHTESRCFRCHQMGHESTNYPARNRLERDAQRSGAQRGDAQRGDRPTIVGRVYALTGAEASTSSDL
ncbi:uncharacterized protein LOC109818085, partial [Cajanus cajan]|uniref:uncharacterized protein LOC109818085 n=1 Tax=Cajanus cajan TaxID=3821 RepID=UPI00098DAF5C